MLEAKAVAVGSVVMLAQALVDPVEAGSRLGTATPAVILGIATAGLVIWAIQMDRREQAHRAELIAKMEASHAETRRMAEILAKVVETNTEASRTNTALMVEVKDSIIACQDVQRLKHLQAQGRIPG